MRLFRLLSLTAVTAGLIVLAAGSTPVGAAPADGKKNKKKQKEAAAAAAAAAVQAAAKPAPAVTPTPVAAATPAAPAKPFVLGPKVDPRTLAATIDTLVDAKVAAANVAPGPLSTDDEFLRRAYLDLTGVIPTAVQARTFLDSPTPDKRARLIDDLLASPNFGRHLADLWQAKLWTKDSANKFITRDPLVEWLAKEFNANTPWDQFATKVITASGPTDENPAVLFFLSNRAVDKLTDGVTQHFMGVQLQCAQCHNHPFTDWKQTEYWGMATFFSHVQADKVQNVNKGGDNTKTGVRETPARTKGKDFFPESTKIVPAKFLGGPEPKVFAGEPLRPVLAKWLTAPDNPFFARAMVNRTWAQLFGAGIVNPVDDMHDGNKPSHPELLAELSRAFAAGGFDVKDLYRAICNSKAYGRTSKPAGGTATAEENLFARQAIKVMSPEQLYDSLQQVGGGAAAGPEERRKGAGAAKRNPGGPRDVFVNFFLAGADTVNPVEYEAGIPQALKLMNSKKLGGGPVADRAAAADPTAVITRIYLGTLSRRPTAAELSKLTAYVRAGTPAEAYGDILWAVLNSSEFTMIR